MASVVSKLNRFGLINTSPSPAERVFVSDVSTETSVEPQQVLEVDEDPDGGTYFTGFESTFELSANDLDSFSTAETWMTGYTQVKALVVLEEAVVQWTTPTRIRSMQALSPSESAFVKAEYMMRHAGGDESQHGVYLTRNALRPYSTSGAFGIDILWPVGGVTVTLSATDPDSLELQSLDGSKTQITADSAAGLGAGRQSITHTTDSNCHFLSVDVTGASAADAALRVDGSDQYVAK